MVLQSSTIGLRQCTVTGEHGAGRNLLQMLNEQEVYNKAIFVLREYGGIHLGQLCFALLKQVVATALSRLPPLQSYPSQSKNWPSASSAYRKLRINSRQPQEAEA